MSCKDSKIPRKREEENKSNKKEMREIKRRDMKKKMKMKTQKCDYEPES